MGSSVELLRRTGRVARSGDLKVLRPGERSGIRDGPFEALGEQGTARVDCQPGNTDQDNQHQDSQWENLAALSAFSRGRRRPHPHGALGSIRSSAVEAMQKPDAPHGGATNWRPGKKIGTTWFTRTRTIHGVWLSAGGQSLANK